MCTRQKISQFYTNLKTTTANRELWFNFCSHDLRCNSTFFSKTTLDGSSPVALAPLLSSVFAVGRLVSTAEVCELVEHPILSGARGGLGRRLRRSEVRGEQKLQLRRWRRASISTQAPGNSDRLKPTKGGGGEEEEVTRGENHRQIPAVPCVIARRPPHDSNRAERFALSHLQTLARGGDELVCCLLLFPGGRRGSNIGRITQA